MKIVVSIILLLISATAINPVFYLYAGNVPQNIQSGLIPTIKSIYKENNIEMVEIEVTTEVSAGRTGKIYFIDEHDNEENVIATIEVVDVPKKGLARAKITGKSSSFQVESGHFVKFDYKFRLFGIAQSYVNRLFVYSERIKPIEILKGALLNVERTIPELFTSLEDSTNTLTVRIRNISKTYDLNKIQRSKDMIEILQDALTFINTYCRQDETISACDIEYVAINGMFAQLDPHSCLMPPDEFDNFKIGTAGVGMVVGLRDGILTVISAIDCTPAMRAGIKAGDKIIEIDGESTINMTLSESVDKLYGDPGTTVILSVISKKTAQQKLFTLNREIIVIPTVESAFLDNGIGYIRIRNFQDDTSQYLAEHLKRLKVANNKLKGLIIDLRNNSGGLLDQAIEVADKFLEKGIIVVTVGPGGQPRETQEAKKTDSDEKYCPIVILVNGSTASGAEIVTAALKENNRAVIVGDRTFGMGSIQQLIELMDGSALKLTIAKYLTPLLTDIQSVGITPDIRLIPVTAGKDTINLYRGIVTPREEDLKQHFDEHQESEPPFATIGYFIEANEKGKTKEPEEETEDPYKLPNFNTDFHVLFAKKLLLNTTTPKREAFLQTSRSITDETTRLEEKKIAHALQKLDIDWSAGTGSGNSTSTISYATNPANGQVKAGEKITLTVTVTNTGEAPLHQLRGISASKNEHFDKLEFILGKIDKGVTKSYSTTVTIPKNSLDREDDVVIKFEELNHNNPKDITCSIITEALSRPLFAYSYQIFDTVKNSSQNNGDGLIQTGEDIDLFVLVKNVGDGPAEKNVVILKNLGNKDIFVKNGRAEIGLLKPGELKEVKLCFLVKETMTSDKITMDMIISDSVFGMFLSNKLILPIIAAKSKLTQTSSVLKIERNHTPLYGGMSFYSPIVSLLKEGTVLESDAKNTDWYRIVLPDKRHGWILANGVAEVNTSKSRYGSIEPYFQYIPPRITLNKSLTNVSESGRLSLSVVIKDDICVKYAYILVNNDKIFYKTNKISTPEEQIRFEINTDLPLKEESNVVTIVACDDQNLVSNKSFVINKD